jgi:hypothetical protein
MDSNPARAGLHDSAGSGKIDDVRGWEKNPAPIMAEELELPVKEGDVAPLFSAVAGGGRTVKNLRRAGLRFK